MGRPRQASHMVLPPTRDGGMDGRRRRTVNYLWLVLVLPELNRADTGSKHGEQPKERNENRAVASLGGEEQEEESTQDGKNVRLLSRRLRQVLAVVSPIRLRMVE